jgi:hypothetical protein
VSVLAQGTGMSMWMPISKMIGVETWSFVSPLFPHYFYYPAVIFVARKQG